MPYRDNEPATLVPRQLVEQLTSLRAALKDKTVEAGQLEEDVQALRVENDVLRVMLGTTPNVPAIVDRYGETTRWLVIGRRGKDVVAAEMHKAQPHPHSESYVQAARGRLRADAYYTQVYLGVRCVYQASTGLYIPAISAPKEAYYQDEE